MSDLVKRLRENHRLRASIVYELNEAAADRIEQLERELAAATSKVEDCTIDLRGAGYDCVCRDGKTSIGVYREGEKVLCEGRSVHLSGLSIFGPVRIKEMEDVLAAERALTDGFKELAAHHHSCAVLSVWTDESDKCACGYDDLAAKHRKARGL